MNLACFKTISEPKKVLANHIKHPFSNNVKTNFKTSEVPLTILVCQLILIYHSKIVINKYSNKNYNGLQSLQIQVFSNTLKISVNIYSLNNEYIQIINFICTHNHTLSNS